MRPQLSVSLPSICNNFSQLNKISAGKCAAVIKANAYGLGVQPVFNALYQTGVRNFFVATLDEAKQIENDIRDATIFELSGLSVFETGLHPQIYPVLNSEAQLKALNTSNFALQFDTGMTRLGFDNIPELSQLPKLIMSHLACADDIDHPQNQKQLHRFKDMCADFPHIPKSLAATEGALNGENYHFDMIRAGIGLYGGVKFEGSQSAIHAQLPIIQIRNVPEGTPIGYGATAHTTRVSKIATIFGGYADGILRSASDQASVYINEIPVPIVGRISMDAIMVDITDIESPPGYVDFIASQDQLINFANAAGTIPYEVLTSLGTRYERTYIES